MTYLLAVLAACANASASVAQRVANRGLPSEDNLRLRLIWHLMRRPVWFLGVSGMTIGFLLQAAALTNGELSVVEPILLLELPLALVLASRVFHSSLHRREWASIFGMTAGLALVLYFLSPSPGNVRAVTLDRWLPAIACNLLLVVGAIQFGLRGGRSGGGSSGGRRAGALGAAAGAEFGMTAALMKGAVARSHAGIEAIFTGWELYAMVAAGLVGLFLMQSALHAGRLLAAQPGLTLADPLISVLWGVIVFGEHIRGGLFILYALLGGVLLVVSVLVLARSPLLVHVVAPPEPVSREGVGHPLR